MSVSMYIFTLHHFIRKMLSLAKILIYVKQKEAKFLSIAADNWCPTQTGYAGLFPEPSAIWFTDSSNYT